MFKTLMKRALLVLALVGCFSTTEAQIFKKKKNKSEQKSDQGKPKKGGIEAYEKVITKEAKTDRMRAVTVKQIDILMFMKLIVSSFMKFQILFLTKKC